MKESRKERTYGRELKGTSKKAYDHRDLRVGNKVCKGCREVWVLKDKQNEGPKKKQGERKVGLLISPSSDRDNPLLVPPVPTFSPKTNQKRQGKTPGCG